MKTIIHLLSGGLDSVVMLHDLASQGHMVHCALFRYGQNHEQELTFAKGHCRKLNVQFTAVDLPRLRGSSLTGDSGSVVVPNRNAIMLSVAVNLAFAAKAEAVTFASNLDDASGFPDCRPEFVSAFNAAVKAAGIEVEVCAPYINLTKRQIVDIGRRLGVQLWDTWSCYTGGSTPCGRCAACMKREQALV
jgi:7-cyano-7-deazaguanine synthase